MLRSVAIYLLGGLLATTVVGCGFHLRTYQLETAVSSFALAGKVRVAVASVLQQNLKQAGVEEATQGEAEVVIDLLDERNQRRSASTAGQSRAAEYEITYSVQYRILDAQGTELAPATWIQRNRVYRIDRGNIVGSSGEQDILRREMLQDVADQIIRAVDTVTRAPSAEA